MWTAPFGSSVSALTHALECASTRPRSPGRGRVSLHVMLLLALSQTGCVFEAVKPYHSPSASIFSSSQQRKPIAPGLKALRVKVVGKEQATVDQAVVYLRDTQLFESVTPAADSDADLTATVTVANGGIRCGNPQLLTWLTLGLIPSGNLYRAGVILSFSASSSPSPVALEVFHSAPFAFGFLALPLRLSPRWEKPQTEDPIHFSHALRDALLDREPSLLALVSPSTDDG